MNETPDTPETDEALDQLCEAALMWEGTLEAPADFPGTLTEALAPIVAAIRRHAAAHALKEHARGLDKVGVFFSKQKLALAQRGDTRSAETYAVHAAQAHADANRLHRAAADTIAEGYEWQCASGTGCCAPVPDAGDLCNDCEANDYDDRWAE